MVFKRRKVPCTYIMASRRNGTHYTGVTSEPWVRPAVHKQDLLEGFTQRYGVHRLVYYDMHETMEAAILREKRIMKWNRAWKLRLIEQMNPEWLDLFEVASGALLDGPADSERLSGEPESGGDLSGFPATRK